MIIIIILRINNKNCINAYNFNILTGLTVKLRTTGGFNPFIGLTPTIVADIMKVPTFKDLPFLRRKRDSVLKALWVMVTLSDIMLDKLLGRLRAPNVESELWSPFKNRSGITLKLWPFCLKSSRSIFCADTANNLCEITTGSDEFAGKFSATDSTAANILKEHTKIYN